MEQISRRVVNVMCSYVGAVIECLFSAGRSLIVFFRPASVCNNCKIAWVHELDPILSLVKQQTHRLVEFAAGKPFPLLLQSVRFPRSSSRPCCLLCLLLLGPSLLHSTLPWQAPSLQRLTRVLSVWNAEWVNCIQSRAQVDGRCRTPLLSLPPSLSLRTDLVGTLSVQVTAPLGTYASGAYESLIPTCLLSCSR